MFKEILRDRHRVHESYKHVFNSAEGQIVMRHMMKKFGITNPSFVQGDSNATAFKEGQRHVVLSILKYINRNFDDVAQKIQEHIEDE